MRKSFFLIIIFVFVLAATEYFWRFHRPVKDSELPTLKMVRELEMLLEKAPYKETDYEMGIFDCSNEAAMTYDFLTANGYKCVIMIGIMIEWKWFPVSFHSWLIAEKDGKKLWVEPVSKEVLHQKYYKDYIILAHFRSLKLLQKISKIFFFPKEWKY